MDTDTFFAFKVVHRYGGTTVQIFLKVLYLTQMFLRIYQSSPDRLLLNLSHEFTIKKGISDQFFGFKTLYL